MSNEKEVIKTEEAERVMLSERLAQGARENLTAYQMIPSISINNDTNNKDFEVGELIKSIKTQNGYENEKYEKPFKGIITKVRMFLATKYKAKEQGAPAMISDEFESFDDIVTLKEKVNDKFEIKKQDYYKNIQEEFSSENKYGTIEKELDLVYCLYVVLDLDSLNLVRLIIRGTSRSNLFSYMKQFSRMEGDFMSSHWTEFSTEKIEFNYKGEPMQFPVWAITFEKKEMMTLEELRKAVDIQIELEKQLDMFKAKMEGKKRMDVKSIDSPKEDLPTIDLDKEDQEEIPQAKDKEEEEEVKIEDIPF